mmetsp:Transcript_41282/g.102334  ORF Transcript_41282/g.102334 Transcript_41282/m.102334 type:complete len:327 (-) Transcript_41282:45-1025(-)
MRRGDIRSLLLADGPVRLARHLHHALHAVLRHDAHGCPFQLAPRVELLHRVHRVCELDLGRVALDPFVLEHLLGREALARVNLEQLVDEVLGVLGDVVPPGGGVVVAARHDLLEKGWHLLLVEGGEAAEQDVQDHAHRPHVHLDAVALGGEDLGRHVAGRAAGRLHDSLLTHHLGQPEVGQLDRRIGRRRGVEQVLRLEVAVADVVRVQVLQRVRDLPHALGRILLGIRATRDDAVEELAARDELHHEVDLGALVEHLVQRDHVGVRDPLHDRDLVLDRLECARLRLVDDLHRERPAVALALAGVHLGKVARTEVLANLVLLGQRL